MNNTIYDQLTRQTNIMPNAQAQTMCPPGFAWAESAGQCVPDDRPSPNRPQGLMPQSTTVTFLPAPTVNTGQQMGDALGTVKSVAMGILNVLTLIGAIGGLAYIWSNRGNIFHSWSRPGYWKGRRAARRGR